VQFPLNQTESRRFRWLLADFDDKIRRATKQMQVHALPDAMKKSAWRAIIEVGFIIFLFYSNLLMGEFERSGLGLKRGLFWVMMDVFTLANFGIAVVAALLGYLVFEFLRKRF
jgi:hypothetical protein